MSHLRSTMTAAKRPLLLFGWGVVLTVMFPKIAPSWVFHSLSGVSGLHQVIGESIRQEGIAAVLAVLGYLREVRTAIKKEKQILVTERDAFEQFADAVESMQVTGGAVPAGSALQHDIAANSSQLEKAKNQYRETVMSMPHYDEDYSEDLFKHMSEELSPEAAIAVADGSELSPQLKELLVTQARLAVHSREELVDTIDTERRSVRSAIASFRESESTIEEAEDESLRNRSFSELIEVEQELTQAMDIVDETIQNRQSDIQQIERRSPVVDRSTFHRYLYRGLKPTFPVLNALLDRYETIRERRREVIRTLARW